jgi:hypothetical protein
MELLNGRQAIKISSLCGMGNRLVIVKGFPFHCKIGLESLGDRQAISHTIREKR